MKCGKCTRFHKPEISSFNVDFVEGVSKKTTGGREMNRGGRVSERNVVRPHFIYV